MTGKVDLNVAWEILNEVCFDGELTRPSIYAYNALIESGPLVNGEKCYLMGAYQHGYSGDRNEILIWNKQDTTDKLEALYHEMVHQYLHEALDEHVGGHPALYYEIYNEGVEKLCQYIRKVLGISGEAAARSTKAPMPSRKQRPKAGQPMQMDTKVKQ